jgi:hypothetical protein
MGRSINSTKQIQDSAELAEVREESRQPSAADVTCPRGRDSDSGSQVDFAARGTNGALGRLARILVDIARNPTLAQEQDPPKTNAN